MITGRVDDYGRALVPVTIYHPQTGNSITVDAWIDTGFTSGLVLTANQIATLSPPASSSVPAALADGSQVMLPTYTCLVDWFGNRPATEAIAGAGQFALLGVRLLVNCTVIINYPARDVVIRSLAGSSGAAGSGT